jgi:L-alanine-DL-glutamate epimerase-like enolase superfamily enzyme
MALWDIKGKVLQLPLHQLLGGSARDYCECYSTNSGIPGGDGTSRVGAQPLSDGELFDRVRAAAKSFMEAGYRAYRMDASVTGGNPFPDVPFNTHEQVRRVTQACKAAREGVGKGDFTIDFHQKFDYADALRCCRAIEQYEPYLVEDPVRTEHFLDDIPKLRQMTSCPLAAGEEWGGRWDFNRLVENHDIDYIRVPLPNTGGITEMMKIAAMCETHSVGIVPHGTGPIATAALVGCLSTFSGPVLLEYNFGGRPINHLPECLDFKNGKAYTNDRPGLGVTLDVKQVKLVSEVTQAQRRPSMYKRPDGSITHW